MKDLIAGFIPTNLIATMKDNKTVKILFVDIKYKLNTEQENQVFGIDQYYKPGKAIFQRTTMQELKKIDGFETGTTHKNIISLYTKAFNNKEKTL